MSSDSQGCSWQNYWKLTSEYRSDFWIFSWSLFFFSFLTIGKFLMTFFYGFVYFFPVISLLFFLFFFIFSSSRITELTLELPSVLIDTLLLWTFSLSVCYLLAVIVIILPDFFIPILSSFGLWITFFSLSARLIRFLWVVAFSSFWSLCETGQGLTRLDLGCNLTADLDL